MDVPTNHARSSCISLRCLGLRLMPCPVGADRMRAPLALEANEEVPCGTDVMKPTYACAIPASTLLRVIDRLPTIA